MNFQLAIDRSDENGWLAEIASASNVYSLVPYLGILFVPVALAVCGVGFVRDWQRPWHNPYRFLLGAGLSLLILCVQVFLWWLLYFIPEFTALSNNR